MSVFIEILKIFGGLALVFLIIAVVIILLAEAFG